MTASTPPSQASTASYMEPLLYDAVNFPSWVIMPTSQSEGEGTKNGSDRGTISPACTACRERHLKCDGVQPICSRCLATQQECHYVRSRRGHRPPRKRKEDSLEHSGPSPVDRPHCENPALASQARYQHTQIANAAIQKQTYQQDRIANVAASSQAVKSPREVQGSQELALSTGAFLPDIQLLSNQTSQKLQEFYYVYFHNSHPILVPEAHFSAYSSSLPASIKTTMELIGSAFSGSITKAQVSSSSVTLANSLLRERSGHTVQALLLLAVTQNSMDNAAQGCLTLDSAIELALELGVNRNSFRCGCCRDDAIMRESWRRTWWELYTIDGIRAAVHMKTFFRLHAQDTDVALPCEESEYRLGPKFNRNLLLSDMDDTAFLDDDVTFSSYAYRITAVRELGNLLCLNQSFCPDSSTIVPSVDASLTSWYLHLPESKIAPLDGDNKIDEIMFQAHMIIDAALIFLHRPRSELIFTSVRDTTSCTPARRIAVPANRYSVHTAKAVEAADRLSSLITLPGQLLKHTPLFTCMVTLAAVVHLSAYVINTNTDQRLIIKERLTLSIGALKTIREVWPIADAVLQRVRAAAREILSTGKPSSTQLLEPLDPDLYDLANSEIWTDFLQEPLFTEMAHVNTPRHEMTGSLYHC